jgi:hypothetical protein
MTRTRRARISGPVLHPRLCAAITAVSCLVLEEPGMPTVRDQTSGRHVSRAGPLWLVIGLELVTAMFAATLVARLRKPRIVHI